MMLLREGGQQKVNEWQYILGEAISHDECSFVHQYSCHVA